VYRCDTAKVSVSFLFLLSYKHPPLIHFFHHLCYFLFPNNGRSIELIPETLLLLLNSPKKGINGPDFPQKIKTGLLDLQVDKVQAEQIGKETKNKNYEKDERREYINVHKIISSELKKRTPLLDGPPGRSSKGGKV